MMIKLKTFSKSTLYLALISSSSYGMEKAIEQNFSLQLTLKDTSESEPVTLKDTLNSFSVNQNPLEDSRTEGELKVAQFDFFEPKIMPHEIEKGVTTVKYVLYKMEYGKRTGEVLETKEKDFYHKDAELKEWKHDDDHHRSFPLIETFVEIDNKRIIVTPGRVLENTKILDHKQVETTPSEAFGEPFPDTEGENTCQKMHHKERWQRVGTDESTYWITVEDKTVKTPILKPIPQGPVIVPPPVVQVQNPPYVPLGGETLRQYMGVHNHGNRGFQGFPGGGGVFGGFGGGSRW